MSNSHTKSVSGAAAETSASRDGALHGQTSVAVGYARLLEREEGAGLEQQRRLIRSEARSRGISLVWSCDTSDQREALDRSGLARSLKLLHGERHSALIVADLIYLTRSLPLLSAIFRRSAEECWTIVSLGTPRIDTTRREDRVLQSVLGLYDTLADQGEAESLAAAVRDAHETEQPSLRERIVWERIVGASLSQIANGLNRDGIAPPGTSGSWLPSAVWAELETLCPGGRASS